MFKKLKKKIADINENPSAHTANDVKKLKICLVLGGSILLTVGVLGAVFSLYIIFKFGIKWIDALDNQEHLKGLLRGLFLLIPFVSILIIGAMILNLGIKIKIDKSIEKE